MKSLKSQVKKLEEFHPDALEIALGAFLDKVLECFYIHTGKGNLEFEDQFVWLKCQDTQEFVKDKTQMALFQGTSVLVSGRLLKLLKDVKLSSFLISQGSAHLSKPIRVAMIGIFVLLFK